MGHLADGEEENSSGKGDYEPLSTEPRIPTIHFHKSREQKLKLCGTYFVELIPAFVAGSQLTYGTIALPAHQLENAFIRLDIHEGSWFVSLLSIFIVIGSLFSSLLSSWLGRRRCLCLGSLCVLSGLLAFQLATTAHLLILGRILCGFGSGLALPTSYLFLHETAIPRHRSALAAWNIFALNFGNLYSLVVGWIFPYSWMPLFSSFPNLIFCACIFRVPESPVYLLERGAELQARDNLIELWGERDNACLEMNWLQEQLAASINEDSRLVSMRKRMTWHNLKSLGLVVVLMLNQSFSGSDTIYNYMITIAQMTRLSINANLASVLLQSGFIAGFSLAPYLVKHVSRKGHFLSTSIGIAVSALLLGLGMSQEDLGDHLGAHGFLFFQLLPVLAICLYSFFYGLGIGSLPFTMMGELLPDAVRNMGNSMAMVFRYASVFLLLKQFPAMTSTIGLNGLFVFHAICCILGAIFVHFCVPETKPKERPDGFIEDEMPQSRPLHHQESIKTMDILLSEV